MQRLTVFMFILMCVGVGSGICHADTNAPDIKVDLRGVVNRAGVWARKQVCNHGESVELQTRDLLLRADASVPPAAQEWVDLLGISGRPRTYTLQKGECFGGPISNITFESLRNRYIQWRWECGLVVADGVKRMRRELPLVLGFVPAEGGDIKSPYVEPGSGVSNLLAFVFHQHMKGGFPLENVPPHELAFLMLNGTTEPLDAAPPLSAGSILHFTAPGIGYSNEITLANSGLMARTIPAGECGQWRIPFEQILAQIPKETVEAIRGADGKLDVVWKTGDIESQPLPLILLPPTQAELDAAFLAEHADVPRIDENTDLSLDFRLAGIEQNKPVFLGWMRNNEKHAVLWDDKSRQYSSIIPSYLNGYSFRLLNPTYGARPHMVEPGAKIELIFSVNEFVEGQRGKSQKTRDEISTGLVLAANWNYFDKIFNPVWIAIPGEDNQLSAIHAYDASWHKLTTFEVHQGKGLPSISGVPDLPPIAPLLAYVHNPETPPELTCVLWNRTEKPVQVAESRIIATNADLGYRRELALPAELELPAEVAPGTHTDWRVPWSAIIEQIPPDDLARIKAADGKLDLVWQANDLASPPLPLLLGWQKDAE